MSDRPLTTEQAEDLYACDICKAGGDCRDEFSAGWTCVEGRTCSMPCQHCLERIWFRGDLSDTPSVFFCPYCSHLMQNSYARVSPRRPKGKR
jgi:hypothetical protein